VGSIEADAYSREEVSFLSLVANQVALAVDDALNFDALQHAKEELRAGEESLRLIVDSIPGLVHSTTAEGKLEFVNRQLLDYFGKTLKLRVAGTIGHRQAKQQRLHDCILTHPRPSLGAIEDHRDVN
jgi:PAS domain-containing protein